MLPGWAALLDLRLDVEKLGRDLSDKCLKMLGLRSRGFDWKEVADALHMSETTARTAFWREIRRAASKGSREGSSRKPTMNINNEHVQDEP